MDANNHPHPNFRWTNFYFLDLSFSRQWTTYLMHRQKSYRVIIFIYKMLYHEIDYLVWHFNNSNLLCYDITHVIILVSFFWLLNRKRHWKQNWQKIIVDIVQYLSLPYSLRPTAVINVFHFLRNPTQKHTALLQSYHRNTRHTIGFKISDFGQFLEIIGF